MKQKYYIKATLDGMKAGYDGYQHKIGKAKHPNPDTGATLCSDGFHMAKSISYALSYLGNATEFYLCCPIGKVYAEDDKKIRAGGIDILWKIPMEGFPAWAEARATCDKAYLAWAEARAAWGKADVAWGKARAARDKADVAWGKADVAWGKARAARDKADVAWDKARAAWDKASATITMDDIIKMHEQSKLA